ncbi:TPA: fimbrial biogenesis outer membrane usher protein [Klebsiella aerogenes]|nr:fimbrial biogenesis outer membrane usher protein [Klebsiella aerogenes]
MMRLTPYRIGCLMMACGYAIPLQAGQTFNMHLLEKNDSLSSVDLTHFDPGTGQTAGHHLVTYRVNGNDVSDHKDVVFHEGESGKLVPCLTRQDLLDGGVEPSVLAALVDDPTACVDLAAALPDSDPRFDFKHQILDLQVPQAMMIKHARGYVSPSRWDEGINALLLNYRFSGSQQWDRGSSDSSSGKQSDNYLNLTSGLNLGPWRLRSDGNWTQGSGEGTHWQSTSTYVERDIASLGGELTAGDMFTASDVFDGVQIRGVGITSDEDMLPEGMNGYAPAIHGIARSNAQVTVRQNGYIIYQTYVTPGAFVIDDLLQASTNSDLDVTIREADGTERHFVQPFASVTQMQREGYTRYNVAAGQYHNTGDGATPALGQLTLMHGFSHEITLFGGIQWAEHYHSTSLGIGKDITGLGAVSLQWLQSDSQFGNTHDGQGQAWQLQYARNIGLTDTTLTATLWHYSDRYATLSDALSDNTDDRTNDDDDSDNGGDSDNDKQKQWKSQLQLNQTVPVLGSLYASVDETRYRNGDGTERSVNVGLSSSLAGITWTVNYSITHSGDSGEDDDRVLSLNTSVPLDRLLPDSTFSYEVSTSSQDGTTHQVGLDGSLTDDQAVSYSVDQSLDTQDHSTGGDVSLGYSGTRGDRSLSYGYDADHQRLSYEATGGVLAHAHGVVLSRELTGSAVLVDAGGAENVALADQSQIRTNGQGYAVLPTVSPYRLTGVALDSRSLPEDVDLGGSETSVIPTHDAIVEARFRTHIGYKALFTLFHQTKPLPFGAVVTAGDSSSIVGSDGQAYLSGLPVKGALQARWGKAPDQQCTAPYDLTPLLTGGKKKLLIMETPTECGS